jgi:DNA-binding LytR/AlgR family response regulator
MQIRCIIVEDEPGAREILQNYLNRSNGLSLEGIFRNGLEAKEFLVKEDIDLMFLDIKIPKLTGIELLKSLSCPPKIIFTTAYSEYALKGFELNAVDYLLKPFSYNRFQMAIEKAEKLILNRKSTDKTILLKSENKIHNVPIHQIAYVEAYGDYVKVVLDAKTLLVHSTFQKLIAAINHERLIRIHRSYAINLDFVEFIESNKVKVKGQLLPIAKSYKQDFDTEIQKGK